VNPHVKFYKLKPEKDGEHLTHLKDFTPVWVWRCFCRPPFALNDFRQAEHLKSSSLMCLLMHACR
jgi:hypothetical protein